MPTMLPRDKINALTTRVEAIDQRLLTPLDSDTLVGQLVGLERQIGRSGRESVDHAPGQHDDTANAAAGALWMASREAAPSVLVGMWGTAPDRPEPTSGLFSGTDYLRAQGRLR